MTWAGSRDTRFRRQIASLLDPARTELPGLALLGALLIGSLWLLFGVLQDLLAGDPLVEADRAVLHLLFSLRVDWATQCAVAVSELGSGLVILPVAGVALLWLDRQHAWRALAYGIASVIGAILFSAGLDLALQRPQPMYSQPGWSLFPFPGGHLAVVAALFGFLTVLMCRELSMRSRIGVVMATVFFIAALTFSRLYLGAEFLSTALESLGFGFAWSALLSLVYLARHTEAVRPVGLGVTTALGLALVGGANIAFAHQSDMQHYTLKIQTQTMSASEWRQSGWASLPVRRLALFGEFDQPFTVQWVGKIAGLKSELLAHGWRLPVNWTPRSTLEFLSPHLHLASLPVLPRLDSGRAEKLVMIKVGVGIPKDERLVFRLWRSDVQVSRPDGSSTPLWIGTITDERTERMFSLLNIPEHSRNMNGPLRRLASDIPCSRIVRRMKGENSSFWDGSVLLGPFKPCGILKPEKSPL